MSRRRLDRAKTCLTGILLVLIYSAYPGCALAKGEQGDRNGCAAIRKQIEQNNEALMHRDLQRLMRVLDARWVAYDTKGRMATKQQQRARTVRLFETSTVNDCRSRIQRCQIKNGSATVFVRTHLVYTTRTARPPQRFVIDVLSREVWVSRPQGWIAQETRHLTETITINGKPFSPK